MCENIRVPPGASSHLPIPQHELFGLNHWAAIGLEPIAERLLSCQTDFMSCLQSNQRLIIDRSLVYQSYPQDRINTQVIYRFALAQVKCTDLPKALKRDSILQYRCVVLEKRVLGIYLHLL